MASNKRCSRIHGRYKGRVKIRSFHENNTKSCNCVVSGIGTSPRWIEIRVPNGTPLSEGKYVVIISTPNRKVEARILRTLRAELSALWSDISNDMRGFKDHSLHMLELDEVLRLELSNFSW